ncbi:MAG: phosphate ABC transporter permease PstA [Actinomycetota bacterium]|nr:phosphate ABC transporter permease PstA [Actinomycetota bacterium]
MTSTLTKSADDGGSRSMGDAFDEAFEGEFGELRFADDPAPLTVLAGHPGPEAPPAVRRAVRKWSRNELLPLLGSLVSALSTTMLLFGRFTSMEGVIGFLAVFFLVFLLTYAVVVSLTENRPAVYDRVMTVLMASAAVVALCALFSVIVYVFIRGVKALVHTNFYVDDLSSTGPLDPLTKGGISHAIVGTLIMTLISLVITVPLGIACSVYLNETRSRLTSLVRTVVTAMTALPSILAGLFIFATWVLILGFERSGLAASIAISIMTLPIMIRSADVVLRLVPGNLREASAALGAPQWRTVWHVVLPTARSGLTTSVILGIARGVGETAPVLLTAGFTSSMNLNPNEGPMVSLPLTAYMLVRSGQPEQMARGFGTAAVLMVLVLILFSIARVLGGRPAGQLSKRQARGTVARSSRDLQRIEARRLAAASSDVTVAPIALSAGAPPYSSKESS